MSEETTFKKVKLFKVSRELNIGVDSLINHLTTEGFSKSLKGKGPNASIIDEDAYLELLEVFAEDKALAARIKLKRAAQETANAQTNVDTPIQALTLGESPETYEAVAEDTVEESEDLPEVAAQREDEPDTGEEVLLSDDQPTAEPVAVEREEDTAATVDTVASDQDTEESEAAKGESASESVIEEIPVAVAEPAAEPAVSEAPVETHDPESSLAAPEIVAFGKDSIETPAETSKEERGTETSKEERGAKSAEETDELILADRYRLAGTKILGKIDLAEVEPADAGGEDGKRKRKRKRIRGERGSPEKKPSPGAIESQKSKKKSKKKKGPAVDETEVEQTLQETLRELEMGASRVRQRRRRQKREDHAAGRQKELEDRKESEGILSITEFVSTGELANHMDIPVNDLISTLFAAGLMVSINQRLDADTITFVADEFGYEVEFISDLATLDLILDEDDPADLVSRPPVVTVMGHVDHGKTSLLDHIRNTNVVSGEAGGITQHIGAYHVNLKDDKVITFLDTPGHEAFTAMRARGAQVTDLVILVVAADDAVMPQTIEAINHAKAASVPIVVAVNKIDKPESNPERVIQQLADHNVLVEQFGGKVQCEYVSAKTGEGVQALLDRVLLEAELLDLKANPNRDAVCTVIESRKERGRGNVASVLVRNGTLKIGDPFVAGICSGRVRAMFDERDHKIMVVGPSMPVQVIGLDGLPDVGDPFIVMKNEKEAKELAQHRYQIHREQSLRQRKHITLDEIGRRLALGDFRELHLIVKGDVAGSVEALADSLLKLSTQEVVVNIVHKGVGAISESDVTLALASDAIIVGFQVRPVLGARRMAEREEIDIRLYSVIYHAISEVRDALEGLLSPEKLENITGTAEVRETFKVPKQGMIAGCFVVDGKIHRSDKIHLIRDGVVIYDGSLASLRRFKDDVKEVQNGYECGIGIENFNDLKIGDQIEAYVIIEKRRKLEEV